MNDPTRLSTESGVAGHALMALGLHLVTHQLPTPSEFQFNDDLTVLELDIAGHQAAAWCESIHEDSHEVKDRPAATAGAKLEWHFIHGRLADSGVRVRLSWGDFARQINLAAVR